MNAWRWPVFLVAALVLCLSGAEGSSWSWFTSPFHALTQHSHESLRASKASETQVNLLISYHSVSGWTEGLAKEIAAGAKSSNPNVSIRMKRVNQTTCEDLIWSNAVVMGSPVYFGSMATEVKALIDRFQTDCFGWPIVEMMDKVGAAFSTGGQVSSGKDATIEGILTAFRSLRMVTVSGMTGYGCSATHDDSWGGEVRFTKSEIEGAHYLGQRVVEVTSYLQAEPDENSPSSHSESCGWISCSALAAILALSAPPLLAALILGYGRGYFHCSFGCSRQASKKEAVSGANDNPSGSSSSFSWSWCRRSREPTGKKTVTNLRQIQDSDYHQL